MNNWMNNLVIIDIYNMIYYDFGSPKHNQVWMIPTLYYSHLHLKSVVDFESHQCQEWVPFDFKFKMTDHWKGSIHENVQSYPYLHR